MRLTQRALEVVKDHRRLKNRLALDLDKHSNTISRWLELNESNGDLTTVKALQLIREETGLSDHEILEEDADKSNSGQGDVVLTLG